mmetsp:Transcript_19587/g.45606  ORF Transcript_19587/g.45606 Transcript_19587/m.45606 type:complete len:209 (+) Transcript_19587:602-1228(+)
MPSESGRGMSVPFAGILDASGTGFDGIAALCFETMKGHHTVHGESKNIVGLVLETIRHGSGVQRHLGVNVLYAGLVGIHNGNLVSGNIVGPQNTESRCRALVPLVIIRKGIAIFIHESVGGVRRALHNVGTNPFVLLLGLSGNLKMSNVEGARLKAVAFWISITNSHFVIGKQQGVTDRTIVSLGLHSEFATALKDKGGESGSGCGTT